LVIEEPTIFRGKWIADSVSVPRNTLGDMFSACLYWTARFSSYYQNVSILLVSYIGAPVARERLMLSGKKLMSTLLVRSSNT